MLNKYFLVLCVLTTFAFPLGILKPNGSIQLFATTLNQGLVISQNGNVGIGTANPTEKLDISGKIALDGVVIAYRPTSMDGTLIIGDGGTNLSHVSALDGWYNTFIGFGVGNATITGFYNSAMGFDALRSNTTGGLNSAMGVNALRFNTTGHYNAAMGGNALANNTTGMYNAAMGASALYYNTTGHSNAAMGTSALYYNTTGHSNSAMGTSALIYNTTGHSNSAMGTSALANNTTGMDNSAMGYEALFLNTTGYSNSAMGGYSLNSNTTGLYNTAMGYHAGHNVSGDNNTFVGGSSDIQGGLSLNNATAIGYNAKVATSNALILGGLGADAVRVGIGTATPSYTLEVQGQIYATSLTVNGTISANTMILQGSLATAIITKSSNYSLTASDSIILVDATSGIITMTLPLASSASGRQYSIKKMDSTGNSVKVIRSGSDTLDGLLEIDLFTQYQYIILVSNGLSNWIVIGGN